MPVDYRIDRDVVVLAFRGETDDPEVATVLDRLADDTAVSPPWRLLLDVRESSSMGRRSPDRIRSLVEIMAGRAQDFGWRFALLVAQDVQFGLARMASAFGDPRALDIHVFRDEDEARAWLGETKRDGNVA